MMGLFGRKSATRELEEAKRAARDQPSPFTTAALIQKYIDAGDMEDALSAAKYGKDVFPQSGSIQTAYRYIKRQLCAAELKTLRGSIKSAPKPAHYQRLAELYDDLGDEDKAFGVAETGIREFPDFEGNHLILGKMRLNRWKEDHLPKDGLLALKHLERAQELNRENYKTLMALSQFYLRVGAREQAEEKLKALLFIAPDDQRAREYLSTAQNLPEPSGTLQEILEDYHSALSEGENGQGAAGEGQGRGPKVNKNPRVLHDKLAQFTDMPGFLGVVVLNRGQELVTSYFPKGGDEDVYGEHIGAIHKAARLSSLQMDIGGFSRGYLESPMGLVYLVEYEDLVFAIICDRNAKVDRTESEIDKFLDSSLYK